MNLFSLFHWERTNHWGSSFSFLAGADCSSLVKMTNIAGGRPYQLSLINVNYLRVTWSQQAEFNWFVACVWDLSYSYYLNVLGTYLTTVWVDINRTGSFHAVEWRTVYSTDRNKESWWTVEFISWKNVFGEVLSDGQYLVHAIKWKQAFRSGWALYHGALNGAQTCLSLLCMPSHSADWGQWLTGLDARQRKWEAAAQWQKQWPSTQPSFTVYGCTVAVMTHF